MLECLDRALPPVVHDSTLSTRDRWSRAREERLTAKDASTADRKLN
jgi:hypothetical protein